MSESRGIANLRSVVFVPVAPRPEHYKVRGSFMQGNAAGVRVPDRPRVRLHAFGLAWARAVKSVENCMQIRSVACLLRSPTFARIGERWAAFYSFVVERRVEAPNRWMCAVRRQARPSATRSELVTN